MKAFYPFLILMLCGNLLVGQRTDFRLQLEPVALTNAPAIHSYAFAKWGDDILFLGGRTSGLHGFRPPFAFQTSGANDRIYVLNIKQDSLWSAPLTSLGASLQDQLSSTNMQFHFDGQHLYLIGGYGYSQGAAGYVTYPYLTSVDVPGLIMEVQSGRNLLAPYFRQIIDQRMAVTGGGLGKIDSTYYLVFGQKFDGRYNPHDGPSFTQTYTEAIRNFQIVDDGHQTLAIANYQEVIDAVHFHRRDYNLVPQIFAGGEEGMTAFTGVFQRQAQVPYLNSVHITSQGAQVDNQFHQFLNHYHTAHLPLYDSAKDEMSTIFFGGIAMYNLDGQGVLVADSLVPFVKTISQVTRYGQDTMLEHSLPIEMPAFLGASAEFVLSPEVPITESGIVRLDRMGPERKLVGYIIGGIESDQQNIFMQATGNSWASDRVFAVYLDKGSSMNLELVQPHFGRLSFSAFPNPASEYLNLEYTTYDPGEHILYWQDPEGRLIEEVKLQASGPGVYEARLDIRAWPSGMYMLTLTNGRYEQSSRIMIQK
jgi:hypothetical protein